MYRCSESKDGRLSEIPSSWIVCRNHLCFNEFSTKSMEKTDVSGILESILLIFLIFYDGSGLLEA